MPTNQHLRTSAAARFPADAAECRTASLKNSMKKLIIITTIILASVLARTTPAISQTPEEYRAMSMNPSAIRAGNALPARSRLIPAPSREEALSAEGRSQYVIPVTQWTRDTLDGGMRYSARFKKHYTWNELSVILRIEGAASSFCVLANGQPAGYVQAGGGRSEFEITDMTRADYNTLEIILFSSPAAAEIENAMSHDPAEGFREAYIILQPTVRIDDIYASTGIEDKEGFADIDVIMQSTLLNPKEYVVHYELISPTGETVSAGQKAINTGMLSRDTVRFTARIPDPLPWNHETPSLYTLLVRSQNEGRFRENIAVRIGFRATGLANGHLTIDGTEVPLYGIRYNANENRGLTASKLSRLKASGYNCIVADGRTQPDYLYALCDSIGLYVCDVTDIDTSEHPDDLRVGGNPSNDPTWLAGYTDRILSMYRSSHLHPSVVMYSPAHAAANGFCIQEGYMALRHADPSRPVFYPEAHGQWNNDLDPAEVFRTPAPESAEDAVTVSVAICDGQAVATIRNNRDLTAAEGTYRLTLRSGRRKISVTAGELDLKGGCSTTITLDGYSPTMRKPNVQVEIHRRRRDTARTPDARITVADMYDTKTETIRL